jgi:uncharacterized protein YggE
MNDRKKYTLLLCLVLLLASRPGADFRLVNAQEATPTPIVPTPVPVEPIATPFAPTPVPFVPTPVVPGGALLPPTPVSVTVPASTITVLGYGTAVAPADSVLVRLAIGGATLPTANAQSIQQIVGALTTSGIAASDILTNDLAQGSLLPGQPAGEVRFISNTPQNLNALLTTVQAALPGIAPGSLALSTVFQVNNCAALETQAVQAALTNAQNKASQMASLLGVQLGSMIAASEAINDDLVNATNPVNCLKLVAAARSPATGVFGLGNNSASAVELFVVLQVTYAVVGDATSGVIALPTVFDPAQTTGLLVDGELPLLTVANGTAVVNVRSAPNTDSEVLGVVRAGEQYLITGRNAVDDWWQIDFNGLPGWVTTQLVTATNTTNVPIVEAGPAP